MAARAALALLAISNLVCAQPAYVDVVDPTLVEAEDVEKRYTPELHAELQSAKDDALLLFTEFSARAGAELKLFIREMAAVLEEAKATGNVVGRVPDACRSKFEVTVGEAVRSAQRAATFSAENHHKFFLAHMVVFRMHLNKSEDFIKKCDKVFKECGIACETTPRVVRWRRHAARELHRVRDDMQHSRRAYEDLLTHSHRKLNHLRKRTSESITTAAGELRRCRE